jgi:hypothetical protein
MPSSSIIFKACPPSHSHHIQAFIPIPHPKHVILPPSSHPSMQSSSPSLLKHAFILPTNTQAFLCPIPFHVCLSSPSFSKNACLPSQACLPPLIQCVPGSYHIKTKLIFPLSLPLFYFTPQALPPMHITIHGLPSSHFSPMRACLLYYIIRRKTFLSNACLLLPQQTLSRGYPCLLPPSLISYKHAFPYSAPSMPASHIR